MILLDTDHITHLKYPESEPGRRLIARMDAAPASETFAVAIVTVEERMRGWLAVIAKEKSALRQVAGYRELAQLFEFYQEFEIAPFDEPAARKFDELRKQKLRIGTSRSPRRP
jgi:tRNA(fMet)-specific endonuclease VapC